MNKKLLMSILSLISLFAKGMSRDHSPRKDANRSSSVQQGIGDANVKNEIEEYKQWRDIIKIRRSELYYLTLLAIQGKLVERSKL